MLVVRLRLPIAHPILIPYRPHFYIFFPGGDRLGPDPQEQGNSKPVWRKESIFCEVIHRYKYRSSAVWFVRGKHQNIWS